MPKPIRKVRKPVAQTLTHHYPPDLPDVAFIDAPQLLARFGGRSHMWLVRLIERDSTFPRPVKIGRLRYFSIADLVKWERSTAAKSRAA